MKCFTSTDWAAFALLQNLLLLATFQCWAVEVHRHGDALHRSISRNVKEVENMKDIHKIDGYILALTDCTPLWDKSLSVCHPRCQVIQGLT